MTFADWAKEYVQNLRGVGTPKSVAADIKTLRIGGRPLTDSQARDLLEEIRKEFLRTGGMVYWVRESSNAGSVSLLALLAQELGVETK